MFGLDLTTGILLLFIVSVFAVCAFEFVNGFHDTANAVATVIYTKSLKPVQAIIWSGLMNFTGVIVSGYWGMGVAMKIANLLPIEALMGQELHHSIAMIMAVLVAAIIWNVGTWYFGIPCSSSHTLIGSLLGVGIVFSWLPENFEQAGVNWGEASKIGNALLFSPAFGFSMAISLMFILRILVRNKQIFKEPQPDSTPPVWIRGLLITTCTLVSFFHGSNDGQKGVGLLMIILMTFMPLQFALAPDFSKDEALQSLTTIQNTLPAKDSEKSNVFKELGKTIETIELLKQDISGMKSEDVKARLAIRKRLILLGKNVSVLLDEPNIITVDKERKVLGAEVKKLGHYTNFVPYWAILIISISLGLGTMIGWKRIVVTIGEKIGKRHMTYAEGATAELIAALTIGLASQYSLPVSTTHVLSSGVAGSMVASKGIKNLQRSTIVNIALAWVLTLPVTIILSGLLFLLFRSIV